MSDHILIARASRTRHRELPDLPADVEYDSVAGYWRKDNKPLWAADGVQALTKKADIETGEDQKGE